MSEPVNKAPRHQYEAFLRQLPADWDHQEITQLGTVVGGGTPSREVPSFWRGPIPWVTPGEVSGEASKLLHDTQEHISPSGLAGSGANLLPAGSLLVTTRATLGARVINAVPMATNQGFKSIVFKKPEEASYYYHLFEKVKPELVRRASGTTFLEISGAEFGSIQLPSPSPEEKLKIAELLDTLDTAIHQTEAIVDKLKQVKQGLLHDLLTRGVDANGELRGQLPASIPFQPLSALAYINPKTTVRLPADAEVSFVPMGATSESGEIVGAELKKWESVGSGMTLFQEDDVLVAKITPCFENGKGGLAQGLKNGFGFGSTEFHVLRGKPDTHPGFIHYWTISPYFRSQGESHMTGTAGQRRVTTEFFDKFLVPAFGFGEQMLIAKILDAQTNRIDAELAELQKLKAQKAGLMEDLLTGRVRVTPLLAQ